MINKPGYTGVTEYCSGRWITEAFCTSLG